MRKCSPTIGPSLFDGQAGAYERRAALPEGVGARVAAAVLELSKLSGGDLLVEVGAGTGLVGRWFSDSPVHYIGFDLSLDMLATFQSKLGAAPDRLLARADGNQAWPVRSGTARAIFSSRALHLLSSAHVAGEALRLAHPEGITLLTGRLRFEENGVRDRMATEMRRRLRARGAKPRGGIRMQKRLIGMLAGERSTPIPRREIARWPLVGTPRQSLEDWRRKPGLGGIEPPEKVKREVLDELERWAGRAFGDLDREFETSVAYTLEGVQLKRRTVEKERG